MSSYILEKNIKHIVNSGKTGVVPHVVAGYPTLQTSAKILKRFADCKIDFVLIQIPFANPDLDHPLFAEACRDTLRQNITIQDAFNVIDSFTKTHSIPVIITGFYNDVSYYGLRQFCRKSAFIGASAVTIPDIPVGEAYNEYIKYCDEYGIQAIHAVTSKDHEQKWRVFRQNAKGFVYCLNTLEDVEDKKDKEEETIHPEVEKYVENLKKYFSIPLAIDIGKTKNVFTTTNKQIIMTPKIARIAIVGHALMEVIRHDNRIDTLTLLKIETILKRQLPRYADSHIEDYYHNKDVF